MSVRIKRLAVAAVFTAFIVVLTAFVKMNTGNGYIHFGDTFIYLAASALPLPYAAAASAAGGALADITSGAAIWALPTAVIKTLMVLTFSSKKETLITKRNVFAAACGAVITVAGYFAAEAVMYSVASAAVSVTYNCIQALGSFVFYLVLASALDRIAFKKDFVLRK